MAEIKLENTQYLDVRLCALYTQIGDDKSKKLVRHLADQVMLNDKIKDERKHYMDQLQKAYYNYMVVFKVDPLF